ncbi:RagB/SusD family nutrient uptake outer membrane protein [Chryseobacterium sp. NKUCC03_KSP]|uniref:RagB/SusD family nutrient uptake outer membrane protein n=1 Tax=Chryseobacterium sp. NKUCC03_KSP TaxID=2842125 RepID=UPI001C5B7453|nr:RagB/SusD family nutrient uptake outer membrane protein [Chryseobacterium sp. NKUCC03_KSP]MBW3521153.1 RagB/SusD family nutrient uptake outer membrane protein [Chryseobacterium sp. NKUCC03_KSP]
MKKLIITLFSLSFLVSCSSDLLDVNPEAQKVSSQFYTNSAEIEQGITSVYGSLQYTGQYQLGMPALGELPSDNTYDEVPANDAFTYGELDFFTIQPNNTLIASTWKDNYIGIQQANIILTRIDKIPDMTDALKSTRMGEMKFLRALMYFNLVRTFGDVPLVLKETTNVNDYFGQPRTPVAEVYAAIETDLKDAIDLLPNTTTQKGRVTKGAALGILGKVLLTEKKYAESLTYLSQIEGLGYQLLTDVSKIFDVANENNAEIIFDVQFASGLNGNSEGSSAFQMFSPSGSVSGAKGHNLPTKEVYNLYSTGDTRRSAYIGLTSSGIPFSKKLVKTSNTIADGGSNFVVLRLADIFLMMAECFAEQNNTVNANLYLNKIKTRAGIATVNLPTKDLLLNEIDRERRLEFVGEGHRWFDLIRTGKAISVMTTHFTNNQGYSTAQIKAHHLLMPVPQGQINTDPALKQNPGY